MKFKTIIINSLLLLAIISYITNNGMNNTNQSKLFNYTKQKHFTVKDFCMVHEPHYDFNDEILPLGATFFARLAEHYLSR